MSPAVATNLRVEWRERPLGIDDPAVRFSWWVKDPRPGARQTAYRVRVGTSEALLRTTPDLWDSGRVSGDRQVEVAYQGAPLGSRLRAFWDVTLWDGDGMEGEPSAPSAFEMGLLAREDWSASWIATDVDAPPPGEPLASPPPAPVFFKRFEIPRGAAGARLYISARGLYDAQLNGNPVDDAWLRPGWTDYNHSLQYQVYDVGELLTEETNVVSVTLGDGWFSGRIGQTPRATLYGSQPSLLAQLEILHGDGRREVVNSDTSWAWAEGPVRGQDLLDGEEFDARVEVDTIGPGRDVRVVDWPEAALVAQVDDGVRTITEVSPVAEPTRIQTDDGRHVYVFDLGQNFAGVARLWVRGPRDATVTLRFAELLSPDGSVYTANLRTARVTDSYTLRGDPEGELWMPRFTYHGFRYVELSHDQQWSGFAPFDRETITGVVLSSAHQVTGRFACSDERVNRLQENIQWGEWSNFVEVPTDCPQRDERLGWTGDAQVFAPTAAFNMDVAAFFTKWTRDLDDAQGEGGKLPSVVPNTLNAEDAGPGWSDARVLCGWAMYQAYGDRRQLERHYAPMAAWVDWQASTATDGVRCAPGCGYFEGYSDWLSLDSTWQSTTSATPRDFIGTAYFASTAGVMAEIARLIGNGDDAARFDRYRAASIAAFNREWVGEDGVLTVQTQTSHLMALAWDLLPQGFREGAFARLLELLEERDWHLSTGFLGTPLLCPVLTRFGRLDVAYRVLLNDDYPGWLFPVRNGATTMWERWNGWTPEHGFGDEAMNSFNHYAYGAIGEWMYRVIGGLGSDPERPGYGRIIVAPQPDHRLEWAEAEIQSVRGPISSRWDLAGEEFALRVVIPANATAEIRLPDGAVHEVGAGHHDFECVVPGR